MRIITNHDLAKMRIAHSAGLTLSQAARWIGCSVSAITYREPALGVRFQRFRFWRPDPRAPAHLHALMQAVVHAARRD